MGVVIVRPGGGSADSSELTASSANVLSGTTAITSDSDGEPKAGTMPNQGAWSKTDLAINGSVTIPAGYHNGTGKVSQSLATQGAVTYYATTTDQTLAAGRWLSGAVTIKAISATNLSAGNIKTGVTISVSNGSKNVWSVAGTYKGAGNAAVSDVLASKTFSTATLSGATGTMVNRGAWGSTIGINGSVTIPAGYHNGSGKITQSIATQGALTYTPSTSVQTAAVSGKYMTGNITINAIPSTYYAPGSAVNFFNAGSYGPLATGGAKVYTKFYRQSSGLKKTMREYIIEDGYGSTATNSGGKLSCYYGTNDCPYSYVYNYEFSIVFRNKFPTSKYSKVVADGNYTLSGYSASTTGRGDCYIYLFGVTNDNKLGDSGMYGDDFHYYSSMGTSTVDVSKITDPWFGIEINGWCCANGGYSSHIDAYVTRIYGVVK